MIRTEEYNLIPDNITTRQSLFAKGTCCKSACMNCPYGFTVKKHGLLFKSPSFEEMDKVKQSLKVKLIGDYSQYELVVLKGYLIGIIKVDELFVTQMYLHPLIDEANISKELIESYYFY
ncbi:MAG: DUF5522 domain-containing protein [Bacteriovoracaceae bacterium]|jgi:hypothetical protein|nr:DUF5522 domain-containing protein [Bacteriovoracaceae bacterium]